MVVIPIKNKLLQSVSYIIGNYIVDCGDGEAILKIVRDGGIEVQGIFLTHCHQDHIYGLPKVMECYPKAKIYCSEMTHKGLLDDSLNLSYIMPEFSFPFSFNDNVVELKEGVHIINDIIVEMIICNGHSNDCQSYIIDGNLFTGDAYIPFARVFTKWPTSDKALAIESEQKLLQLANNRGLVIRPGHWQ